MAPPVLTTGDRWAPAVSQVDAGNLRLGGPTQCDMLGSGVADARDADAPDYRRLPNAVFSVSGDCLAPISGRQLFNGNRSVAGV
jgi:hypothetical protein